MTSSTSSNLLIPNLSPREAITDAIYRAVTAIDSNDAELWATAASKDITFEFKPGDRALDYDALWAFVTNKFHAHFLVQDTTHITSNIRIFYTPGQTTARATFHSMNQHYNLGTGGDLGAPHFLVAGLSAVDLVQDTVDGVEVWKFRKWVLNRSWVQGDFSVLQ
ncbi:hypothetical protein BD324DRAFT_205702 [Kockovaella imperatae]|uniref:SnoaL-like domain-containing protein n=1 Tax=Kockovaella imperatae TaxID=4999 RepID=A0A1Y1U8M1_9TREE|nr:hypothetical protein BD324DRAFT_205702 [Kockovaella imperatae]ORX33846.1 hypothetical protein BD324DRAFT_205702 [Kockovaella imperatae]